MAIEGALSLMRLSNFEMSVVVVTLLFGCSDSKPLPVGAEGAACASGGGCDPGLICLSQLCVMPSDSGTNAASGGAGGNGTWTSAGGTTGSGGNTPSGNEPCDIYASVGGPCVAAHSTVRRLVSNYIGPLYQDL